MVTQTTPDTPLELARKQREEETKQLMGFGADTASKMDLTEMQEIQNMFNTHKRMGSDLLQSGRITTEQYYENTRKMGIKLGVIGPDEYPNDLPSWLKPTLEIGGAVIGGIIPYVGGPAGVGTKLVAESVGSGLGSASGTALYGLIADLAAPDGMPTQSWSEIGKEAATEGAIVTGLTAGILKSIPAIGSLAKEAGKISPKTTEALNRMGKGARNKIINSPTGQRLKAFGGGYLIKQEKVANELLQELRNNGIEPSYSMLIQNDTVRSLIQALARTPILGTPERESYELIKKDIFKRITEGVTPGSNTTLEQSLGAFSSNFVLESGKYRLKKGVKERSLRDISMLSGFLREQGSRNEGIQATYNLMKSAVNNDKDFAKRLTGNDFAATRNWWLNINNTESIALTRGRSITDILDQKASNTGLYFNLLFSPQRLAEKELGENVFRNVADAEAILKNANDDFIDIDGMLLPLYKKDSGIEGFIPAQEGKTIFASNDDINSQLILKLNNGEIPLGGTLPTRFGTRSYNEIKQNSALLEEFNTFLKGRKIKQTTSKPKKAKFVKKDGTEMNINKTKAEKYTQENLTKRTSPEGELQRDGAFFDAASILATKKVSGAGQKFLSLSRGEQLLQAQKSLNDDLATIRYYEKSLASDPDLRVIGAAYDSGRANMKNDLRLSSNNEQLELLELADKKFVDNLNLLDRSKSFLQAHRQISTGADAERFLRFDRIFSGKVPRLDVNGERIASDLKAKLVPGKDGKPAYYEVQKNSQGTPIKMTTQEQIGGIPGLTKGQMTERMGGSPTDVPDAQLIDDLFRKGTPTQVKEFRELVGKEAFRKMAQDEIDSALNNTLIKYINGSTDDGIGEFWKAFGIGKFKGAAETKARMSAIIDQAGLSFKYSELESFGHMLRYLNGAPQLNQFIQRSMILRFSQGVGPSAVGGLFLGGGGLAAGGVLGSLAGLGGMYFLNKMMASRVYGPEVRGALKNYASAVAAGNKEKAEEAANLVLRRMESFSVPFQKQMAVAASQTGINLGVTNNLE